MDSRVRGLLENCVATRQRGLFVIVGDKGRDQVVNLHYMLSKTTVKARPSVLWCYKNDLYLSRFAWPTCTLLCRSCESLQCSWANPGRPSTYKSQRCSHRKKRMRQINKMSKRGLLDAEKEDPFSLFVSSTNIRYCFYKDTPKILGNTFGMCVLQVSL